MSIGSIINRVLDKILPDVVGDVVGAAVDGITGNPAGAVRNGLDAVEDVLEFAGADAAADAVEDLLGFTGAVGSMACGAVL